MNIKNFFKQPIVFLLEKAGLYSLYSLRNNGPLYEDGWFRSNREQASVDAAGEPLPWITYSAIDFIRERIKSNMTVFEFGSGGSTKWWASQVRKVVSVEHDRCWFEKINPLKCDNAEIVYINLTVGGDYSKYILNYDQFFDIVVIDGRDRVNCMKNCLQALNSTGVIILDNSNRSKYMEGIRFLQEKGFKKIQFSGFCPIVNIKSETAIFYRNQNIFGI